MPLALRPNITSASRQFDHLVMSGELALAAFTGGARKQPGDAVALGH